MQIKRIIAKDFLNLNIDTELSDITVLEGENGMGKTNFLEAVYFAALGRAMRPRPGRLIACGKSQAHVRLDCVHLGVDFRIDAVLDGKQKRISVDHMPISRLRDLYGRLLVVAFLPGDLRLVYGSAADRRRFLDTELCQISPIYVADLAQYHKALKHRSAVLRQVRAGLAGADQLAPWDDILAAAAPKLCEARADFIEQVFGYALAQFTSLCSQTLDVKYKPNVSDLADALLRRRESDIRYAQTTAGPHLDDFEILLDSAAARGFASQGQARTAVLAIKLGLVEYIKARRGVRPVVLLDDVLSELDPARQKNVLRTLAPQSIVTTAQPQFEHTKLRIAEGEAKLESRN